MQRLPTRTRTTSALVTLGVLLVLTPGCKKKQPGKEAKKDPKAALAAVKKALPEINRDASKTVAPFSAVLASRKRLAIAAPDWPPGYLEDSYKPDSKDRLGFHTHYQVGSNCDGVCTAKNWKKVTHKVEFARLKKGGGTIEDRELGGRGRLLVIKRDDITHVVVVRYKKGADRYFYCRATLGKPAASQVTAFRNACLAMQVVSWD